MIKLSTTKRVIAAACCVAALGLGGPALFAAPASAVAASRTTASAGMIPAAAEGCNNNICAYFATPSDGKITVHAWVYESGFSFYGHYELTWPGGHNNVLPERNWTHTENHYWTNYAAIAGKWCVIGWRDNGGGNYTNIGEVCKAVK
jgi:hypothetical protein